jgi:hypothetical protein
MACYTVVGVEVEDNEHNRKARALLGLPEKGLLSAADAARVKKEAGIIKTQAIMRRLNPSAVIRRVGDKLTIQVNIG